MLRKINTMGVAGHGIVDRTADRPVLVQHTALMSYWNIEIM